MDPVADGVAGYAALVGTASLGWQIYRVWRASRPSLVVELSNALTALPGKPAAHYVCVTAVNKGEHRLNLKGTGLYTQDGTDRVFVPAGVGPLDTIPGPVEPHDDAASYFDADVLKRAGFNLQRPMVAFVRLATGDRIQSKPKTLLEASEE